MNSTEVKETIENILKEIANNNKKVLPELQSHLELVDDLGFTSLNVAELIANLEEQLEMDPFQDEDVMITDIRTIGDLCNVYISCFEKRIR